MAREKFESRTLTGNINVACKYDDGTVRYWTADKADVIEKIKHVVNEYRKDGYILTLRQLHYQLVTQNWIVNHDTAYKKLGGILDDCRYAGIIDWNAIEDRGRIPWIPYSVKDIPDALRDTIDQYRLNRQEGQQNHIELWTEKDALSGILRRTTSNYHVKLVVNKGYTSSSALYNAYERCVEAICAGKKVIILYFGDHDPSGLDMIRDISERLTIFLTQGDKLKDHDNFQEALDNWWKEHKYNVWDVVDHGYCSEKVASRLLNDDIGLRDDASDEYESGVRKWFIDAHDLFKVVPIGLTMEQIKKYKLPPNPTKLTDTRADKYIKKFGKTCWEVDALKPQVLTAIVEANIETNIDTKLFNKQVKKEETDIAQLEKIFKTTLKKK